MSNVHALLLPVTREDDALLIDVLGDAERRGLVLVTDGQELKYTLPHAIPPGWTRFAMRAPGADRTPEPIEPRS